MQVNLNKKKILITGGTGSLGKILIKKLLKNYTSVEKIIVFSRDEFKQSKLSRRYKNCDLLKFVIGDIRDSEKLLKEFQGIDLVIHAAAMKSLDVCENNPDETFKTNVLGTKNVIEAAIANQVQKVLFISTDKAAEPISTYGRSKADAEQLIIGAAKQSPAQFTILRLGNIFKSRGSVFEVFKEQSKTGSLTLFDQRSTRYLIKSSKLFQSIHYALTQSLNSVVLIPKLPVFNVKDLAKIYCSSCLIEEMPVRKGERVHELLFSKDELSVCYEDENYYYLIKDLSCQEALIKEFSLNKVNLKSPVSSKDGQLLSIIELEALTFKNKLQI